MGGLERVAVVLETRVRFRAQGSRLPVPRLRIHSTLSQSTTSMKRQTLNIWKTRFYLIFLVSFLRRWEDFLSGSFSILSSINIRILEYTSFSSILCISLTLGSISSKHIDVSGTTSGKITFTFCPRKTRRFES
jgi:hypothetical protein